MLGDDVEDHGYKELGKLSEHGEPGCVMGTISKIVQHPIERFWQKPIRLNQLI
jgi:hypothetical protein